MKLNYKRTILVGFAFFLISAFWQAYDKTIPLLMTYKFNMTQTQSGVIMALDNVILTPHCAWGAYEARERCMRVIVDNIKSFLKGERLNRVDA